MKKIILILLAFCYLIFLTSHRRMTKPAEYYDKSESGECREPSKGDKLENMYNKKYAKKIEAKTECTLYFFTNSNRSKSNRSRVFVDLVIGDYVIEAGIDRESSLDSVQQALFASLLTGKRPAVVIYNTTNKEGVYTNKEGVYAFRIRKVSEKLNIEYCFVDVTRMSGMNRLSEDDCPWERKPKKKKK